MSKRDELLASTAMLSALRYRAYELYKDGQISNVTIVRKPVFYFRLSNVMIEVVVYYAFNWQYGIAHPWSETEEGALLHVVYPAVEG